MYLILILFFGLLSCNTNEDAIDDAEEEINQLEKKASDSRDDTSNNKMSCNDLIYDSVNCTFTTGCSLDTNTATKQFMVDKLNCYLETLPANRSWDGDPIVIPFSKNLTNCCYPAYAFNSKVNSWRNTAQNNRPNSDYLIIGYELNEYYMTTANVKVTYRKMNTIIRPTDFIQKR